ncbi:hypothetical protein SELMODRAFT_128321, partial [Selaginella moellendorffii]
DLSHSATMIAFEPVLPVLRYQFLLEVMMILQKVHSFWHSRMRQVEAVHSSTAKNKLLHNARYISIRNCIGAPTHFVFSRLLL